MEANNVLSQLTFSESSPVKTMLLQQKYFGLMRIALGKGVKIPPHQGGAFGFFSGFAGQRDFHLRERGR